MKTRYYLHGDQHEDGGDKWFCARCDSFVDQSHFYHSERHVGSEGDKDYPRYLDGKKRLHISLGNSGGKLFRPPSPRNCIE